MTDIVDQLEAAGLTGRGGAAFSTAIKVKAAREHRAAVIVNACDGEVGAAKDAWIVQHHLHELVEGAALVTPGRRPDIRYAAHRGSRTAQLLAEAGLPVLEVPPRYVSSEETSLISLAQGGLAKPMTKRAPFIFGGRDSLGRRVAPTLVLNAETVWRVSQLHRKGPAWFRSFGTTMDPGPRLVSIGGHVRRPGVYETAAGVTVGDLLALAGGVPGDAQHVNIGGLGGILSTVADAEATTWDTPGMKARGGSMASSSRCRGNCWRPASSTGRPGCGSCSRSWFQPSVLELSPPACSHSSSPGTSTSSPSFW